MWRKNSFFLRLNYASGSSLWRLKLRLYQSSDMVLMSEDQRLLRRLRAGDKDALRRIYEKYIDDLLRVALSLLSDVQAADDCLHDVFVDLAGAAEGLIIRSNLKSC
jgi:hypothetical protein